MAASSEHDNVAYAVGFDQLVTAGVAVTALRGGGSVRGLWHAERSAVQAACAARRHEYAAVRECARRAMVALGEPRCAVPTGRDRQPLWPAGLVGSMTHCHRLRAAAVARSASVRSVGIDAEPAHPLPAHVVDRVVGTTERAALGRLPAGVRSRGERIAFVAKEAFYKAWFPMTATSLSFLDVRLTLRADETFRVVAIDGRRPPVEFAHGIGRWHCGPQFVIAAFTVPVHDATAAAATATQEA